MAIKLDKDVRQVVVLRGGSRRQVYDVDRDNDDDGDIRITVIRRDETGRLVARERYEGEGGEAQEAVEAAPSRSSGHCAMPFGSSRAC